MKTKYLNSESLKSKLTEKAYREGKTLDGVYMDIGDKLHVSKDTVRSWTRGHQPSSEEIVKDLADTLKCNPNDLKEKKNSMKNINEVSLWKDLISILEDVRSGCHDKTTVLKLIKTVKMARFDVTNEFYNKLIRFVSEYLYPLVILKDVNTENLVTVWSDEEDNLEVTYGIDLYEELINTIGIQYIIDTEKEEGDIDYSIIFANDLANAILDAEKNPSCCVEIRLLEEAYRHLEGIFA